MTGPVTVEDSSTEAAEEWGCAVAWGTLLFEIKTSILIKTEELIWVAGLSRIREISPTRPLRHRSRRNPIRTSQRYSHLRFKAQAWPCRATTKARRRSRLPAPLCRRSSLHCRRMPSRPRTLVPHRTSIERTNPKVGWEMAKSRLFPQRKTQSRHHLHHHNNNRSPRASSLRLYYFIRGWGKIVLFLVRT